MNQTKQDWQLIASVEGEGFYGPPVMVAKACLTSYYPLMFRPISEDSVKVFSFFMQFHFLKLLLIVVDDQQKKPDPKSTDNISINLGEASVDQCLRWQ